MSESLGIAVVRVITLKAFYFDKNHGIIYSAFYRLRDKVAVSVDDQ